MDPGFELALNTAAAAAPVSDAPKIDIRGKSRDDLLAMRVGELKQVLTDNKVDITGLLEKADLVDKIMQLKSHM